MEEIIKKNCLMEKKDYVRVCKNGFAYTIDVQTIHGGDIVALSPQDFAELAIAAVLDVAKRHPKAYRAAAIKAGVVEPRWVEKPGEEIKSGDWVKCKKFALASHIGEIEKCTGVRTYHDDGTTYVRVKGYAFGAKDTYVKVVKE